MGLYQIWWSWQLFRRVAHSWHLTGLSLLSCFCLVSKQYLCSLFCMGNVGNTGAAVEWIWSIASNYSWSLKWVILTHFTFLILWTNLMNLKQPLLGVHSKLSTIREPNMMYIHTIWCSWTPYPRLHQILLSFLCISQSELITAVIAAFAGLSETDSQSSLQFPNSPSFFLQWCLVGGQ